MGIKIESFADRPMGGVIAHMVHSCGHVVEMYYGSEEFALADEQFMRERPCLFCQDKNFLQSQL